MINKMLSFCLLLFTVLYFVECSPHLYRRHHSYYHHRSPYHVNYRPVFFGVESSLYNDLEDHSSNEPVKGGIKNTNQNPTIKTPMKLFSERKNGYLSSSLGSFQEKLSGTKLANPSSIKQSSIQESSSSIIYPNPDSDLNENTAHLPVLDLNEKKIESSLKKGSKTNPKSKPSLTSIQPSSTTTTTVIPIKIENTVNTVKDTAVNDETNLKTNQLNKVASSSAQDQPATTLSSLNIIDNLEIKEIKIDTVAISEPNVVKINSLNESPNVSKAPADVVKPEEVAETETVKLETVVVKPEEVANKPVDVLIKEVLIANNQEVANKPESIVNNETPVAKPEVGVVDSVVKVPVIESKPIIMEDSPVEVNLLDVRKKVVEKSPGSIDQVVGINAENPVSSVVDQSKNAVNSPNKSSVDVSPVAANTENSLVLENATDSPLVN